jgi:transcriptional regulator with XRE-family HTH domain
MKTQSELLAEAGLDREEILRDADRLRAELRAARLREVRDSQSLTQSDVAKVMHTSQAAVSQIETGEVDRAKVMTLRRYVEALGGELRVEARFGDTAFTVA